MPNRISPIEQGRVDLRLSTARKLAHAVGRSLRDLVPDEVCRTTFSMLHLNLLNAHHHILLKGSLKQEYTEDENEGDGGSMHIDEASDLGRFLSGCAGNHQYVINLELRPRHYPHQEGRVFVVPVSRFYSDRCSRVVADTHGRVQNCTYYRHRNGRHLERHYGTDAQFHMDHDVAHLSIPKSIWLRRLLVSPIEAALDVPPQRLDLWSQATARFAVGWFARPARPRPVQIASERGQTREDPC